MSTSAVPHSFGLSYLDEQQRFKRRPNQQAYMLHKPVMDISGRPVKRTQARVPRRNVLDLSYAVPQPVMRSVMQPISPTILHNVTQQQSDNQNTVFAEQFEAMPEQAPHKKHAFRTVFPLAVAAVALVSGLAVFGFSLHQNKQAAAQVTAIVKQTQAASNADTTDESIPSEEPVTETAKRSYAVIPDTPRLITIEKIKVFARVMPMGILKSGALATPRNTYDAGWYTGSSKPGDGGATLIVGHALGGVGTGVFYNIKKLNVGDTIKVERGDGQVFSYIIRIKEQVAADKVDNAKLLLPVTVGKPGLNVMTCGGKFDAKEQAFDDRVIVYAEQI